MIITNFTPKAVHSPIDLNVVTDAPLPSEMPFEAQAAFSLGQLLDRSAKELNRHLGSMLKCQPGAEKMYDALVAGGAAELLIAEFGEQVHTRRIRSLMWVQQLRQSGAGMTHCRETLPMEQRQRLDVAQARILLDLQERFPPPTELAEEFKQNISSSNDFFDKLLELIDLIKNGYLAGYEHVIAAYSEFFKEFNEAITAKMKEWITGVDDGKKVDLNVGALRRELDKLIVKYSPPNPGAVLFPAPGKAGATKEEADNWRKALGLPDSCLIQNDDGTYSVVMDISPLTTMRGSLPGGNTVRWDTAKFQAWQTGFNAQEERMKNMLQSFTQKYSNANSYHDNFNKTLSAHLSQYSDMLKAMLNF